MKKSESIEQYKMLQKQLEFNNGTIETLQKESYDIKYAANSQHRKLSSYEKEVIDKKERKRNSLSNENNSIMSEMSKLEKLYPDIKDTEQNNAENKPETDETNKNDDDTIEDLIKEQEQNNSKKTMTLDLEEEENKVDNNDDLGQRGFNDYREKIHLDDDLNPDDNDDLDTDDNDDLDTHVKHFLENLGMSMDFNDDNNDDDLDDNENKTDDNENKNDDDENKLDSNDIDSLKDKYHELQKKLNEMLENKFLYSNKDINNVKKQIKDLENQIKKQLNSKKKDSEENLESENVESLMAEYRELQKKLNEMFENKFLYSTKDINNVKKQLKDLEKRIKKVKNNPEKKSEDNLESENIESLMTEYRELQKKLNEMLENKFLYSTKEINNVKKQLKDLEKRIKNARENENDNDKSKENNTTNIDKKKIAIACTSIIAATIFVTSVCLLAKKINNSKNKTVEPEITTQLDNSTEMNIDIPNNGFNDLKNILISMGYDESIASLLTQNYLNAPGFNILDIENYENARNTYQLTGSKAVDYVNRAYNIKSVGILNDKEINYIVGVINSIDNRNIITVEDADYLTEICDELNAISFDLIDDGQLTPENAMKLNNLHLLAEVNSDLYYFLVEYENLLSMKVANPTDETIDNAITEFITTFAINYNGSNIYGNNKNATIVDSGDYRFACHIINGLFVLIDYKVSDNTYNANLGIQELYTEAISDGNCLKR